MARSRLSIMKPQIEAFFYSLEKDVLSPADIQTILATNGHIWRLPFSLKATDLISFLCDRSKLKRVSLDFPSETINRYLWDKPLDDYLFPIATSLKKDAYLSHYTSIFIHELSEQIPKNIYVTFPQPRKTRGELTQLLIDNAMRKPPQETTAFASCGDYRITLINGMSKNAGIVTLEKEKRTINVTNLERTLIDCTVKPNYAGGVFEVLKAYRNASRKLSVSKIKAYLAQIDFVYPYHQAIGFYLQLVGIDDNRLQILKNFRPMDFDFYLAHGLNDLSYSKEWRLYYPKEFDYI